MGMASLALIVGAAGADAQVAPSAVLYDVRFGYDLIESNNNIALDSTGGLTDPLFTVGVGQSLLFGVSLSNNRPDQLVATFGGAPATLADPNVDGTVIFAPSLGGGNNYRELLTFSTAGTYVGSIKLNLLASNPDYAFDGGPASVEAPTFTYRINVLPAAVPEPATWAAMTLGFGLAGASFRRRRPARA